MYLILKQSTLEICKKLLNNDKAAESILEREQWFLIVESYRDLIKEMGFLEDLPNYEVSYSLFKLK
jgi:hypothetical protein